ncbi:MAG: primase-helicase family protein, partial [Bacteroidota bacterium]
MDRKALIRQNYLRVGIHYFKRIKKQDPSGNVYTTLEKWSKETIKDDYSVGSDSKPYLLVPKYDQFCNIPDNSDQYQQVQNCTYNIYQKPTHEPREGSIEQTMTFLKHIYSEDYLDFGLDYITLLWTHPKQRLPIHCLVSKAQKTGKSTFLHWLRAIFQSNMAVIQNHDFESQFNAHYANKNYLAVDETQMDIEKRANAEKIKYITTSPSTYVNFKGVDKKEVDYYAKLFLNSNLEEDFVYIESEDTRFFIRKVPPVKQENPDFFQELCREIPAFLYFLENRDLVYPRVSRLWFDPAVYQTEARQKIIQNTKPKYQRIIDNFIEECFQSFEVDELKFTPKDIWDQVRDYYRFIDQYKVRDYLRQERGMCPLTVENGKVIRYECYKLQQSLQEDEPLGFLQDEEVVPVKSYKVARVGR